MKLSIKIFALAATGSGVSGSDRIFIEFARRWLKKMPVTIITSSSGRNMIFRMGVKNSRNLNEVIVSNENRNFLFNYIKKVILSVYIGLTLKIEKSTLIYSASEFWMDSLPCFLLKLRYPSSIWIASWYQTAPNPLKGFSLGDRDQRYHYRAFLYWVAQLPIKPIIERYADFVLVNNEGEKKQFAHLNRRRRVVVVLGAVNTTEAKKFLNSNRRLVKKYEAVFQGRLHPQKGVVELVKIWRKVVDKIPKAKLMVIGDGPLMKDVKDEIKINALSKNIDLLGYIFDGRKKYQTFLQSKVVVHPAFYDSGGMASAEAMVFGLPAIGFDLPSYKSYYPQGMIKVPIGDLDKFADETIKLLKDKDKLNKLGYQAQRLVFNKLSWDTRAEEVLQKIIKLVD